MQPSIIPIILNFIDCDPMPHCSYKNKKINLNINKKPNIWAIITRTKINLANFK